MKIAIIGAGISGMVTAYLLSAEHDLTIFEANAYIGGHTHTIDVLRPEQTYAVDTGFIVFNAATYPNFITLLQRLRVPWQHSDMSFGVTCAKTGLEYSPRTLNALFIQRKNLVSPRFYRMLLDIPRFKREAAALLGADDDQTTLGDYLRIHKYSDFFIRYFIIPMGAAIWSTDPKRFFDFPARYFVQFFENHGFLNLRQPQWFVIQGGSRQYVEPLTRAYRDRIRLNCPVTAVTRHRDAVEVVPQGGEPERFDRVILAAHSDQALAMLADPSDAEREILGAIPYQENVTVLHTDHTVLPKHRAAWASWNYHLPPNEVDRVTLTYYMNRLQTLRAPVDFCVTLNRQDAIAASQVVGTYIYHHPLFTPAGIAAQKRRAEINGVNRTYFCGAYWSYGFHEDGVKSALAVCEQFGKTL
jgi:predicted NAD/FAD-binding protein